jgi:hypothetical protein
MKETILQLHEEMAKAIGQPGGDTIGTARIEKSYNIAADYWQRVKKVVRRSVFASDAEEIDFFRNRKVMFTGVLEYYLLLFRFQMYADTSSTALENFRRDETDRIRKFRETHGIFITYYEQGRAEWDDQYFLRRKFHKAQRPPSQVYDRAPDLWTNGDWIITLHHGNRLFEEFLWAAKHPKKSPAKS